MHRPANMADENISPLPIRPRGSSTYSMGSVGTASNTSGQPSRRTSTTSLKKEKKELHNLAVLLALEKDDNRQLRQLVEDLRTELTRQGLRTEKAENELVEVTRKFMTMNQERLEALHEVTRLRGQLKLYEFHLNTAKAEIRRGQRFIDELNARRVEAEKLVSDTKNAKDRLSQELLAREWKDEGMKEGFIQGMERARAEAEAFLTMSDQLTEQAVLPDTGRRESSTMGGDGDSFYYRTDDETRRQSSTTDFTVFTRPETPVAHNPPSAPPPQDVAHPHDDDDDDDDPPPIPIPNPRPPTGDIRPIIIHNAPPSPRHPPVQIPPEGFIPITGASGDIVLPPSHELAPPPPIPSPGPSFVPLKDEAKLVPPPGALYTVNMMHSHPHPHPHPRSHPHPHPHPHPQSHSHSHRHHHPGSPESNSTTISQFEMVNVNDGFPKHSPMSAIPEVASERNSPIPSMNSSGAGAQDLHRNTSLRSQRSSPHPHPHSSHLTRAPSRQEDHRSHHSQSPHEHNLNRKSSLTSAASSSRRTKTPDKYGIYQRSTSPSQQGVSGGSISRGRTPSMPMPMTMPVASGGPAHTHGHGHAPSNILDDTTFINKTPKARTDELPEVSNFNPRRSDPLADTSFLTKTPRSRPDDLPDEYGGNNREPAPVIPTQAPSGPSSARPHMSAGIYTRPYPSSLQPDMGGGMFPSPSWHSEESSANYNVDIESPTPPQSEQFEENPREFREYLSASDAARPLPVSPRTQPSNMLHSVPMPGTPIATPGGIFIPTGPPSPSPGRRSSSPHPPSPNRPASPLGPRGMPGDFGYVGAIAGGPDESEPPVIPNVEELLRPHDSDEDSDAASSGFHSTRTLTTPPITVPTPNTGKGKGRGGGPGGASAGGARGGKKKKR
ncbi:hypothetical protein D9758_008480 [Tetrapyrgos nigripes]|uniref:Uncharacterized protein n=1 Tax=Tetrapyrgos nigripes TaxID=182062 RepID=A0A8H5FPZ4_9AGAR|nr:hypothetical protein D9758_008480 [Tetrapyrgos nigripes]